LSKLRERKRESCCLLFIMPPLLSVPEWDGDNFFTYFSQRESKMPLKIKTKRVTYFNFCW
jgi:hypothetical protein